MNLFKDYGRMTLEELRVPVNAYQAVPRRHAQNDYQFYVALSNSVDEDTKAKMQLEEHEYMVGPNNDIVSSLLYFKKLIMKGEVDSRAIACHIRDNFGI